MSDYFVIYTIPLLVTSFVFYLAVSKAKKGEKSNILLHSMICISPYILAYFYICALVNKQFVEKDMFLSLFWWLIHITIILLKFFLSYSTLVYQRHRAAAYFLSILHGSFLFFTMLPLIYIPTSGGFRFLTLKDSFFVIVLFYLLIYIVISLLYIGGCSYISAKEQLNGAHKNEK